jgi:glycosyltransferase involved in cell wall biosynthesis
MYLPVNLVSLSVLRKIVKLVSPAVIYLNSFFDPLFTQRVLWLRKTGLIPRIPIILAPRGEFSAGALRLKNKKKILFLRVIKLIGLYENLNWHASSSLERRHILAELNFVKNDKIIEAINLAPAEINIPKLPSQQQVDLAIRVCFLSRISPIKNLDFALKVLMRVKIEIIFTVYGPKEDYIYWKKCEEMISVMPSNIRVIYGGELIPAEVRQVLAEHDFFFLPTCGENYGHVIHEALSAGLPVLISDQTPWNEVADRGVGWVCSLDEPDAFAFVIENYASLPSETILEIRLLAADFAKEKSINNSALIDNRILFDSALRGG